MANNTVPLMSIFAGDDLSLELVITNSDDNSAADLTGWTFAAALAKGNYNHTVDVLPTDLQNGIVTLTMSETETNAIVVKPMAGYSYDIYTLQVRGTSPTDQTSTVLYCDAAIYRNLI